MHGHWVLDVHDPDGTLVTHLEFDNALVTGGASLLAQFDRQQPRAMGHRAWRLRRRHRSRNGGTYNGFPQNSCLIVDGASVPLPTGTAVFPTLTEAIGGTQTVVLTGTATALVQGQIQYVATRQGSCGRFTAPASCNPAGTVLQFTVHDLVNSQGQPTPLSIAAGQIVKATVTLSFS